MIRIFLVVFGASPPCKVRSPVEKKEKTDYPFPNKLGRGFFVGVILKKILAHQSIKSKNEYNIPQKQV
jgi:hypothetical protein